MYMNTEAFFLFHVFTRPKPKNPVDVPTQPVKTLSIRRQPPIKLLAHIF